MHMIRRQRSDSRMSQIVAFRELVFLSGQVAVGAPDAPFDAQMRDTLDRIDDLLCECGSDRGRILSATIWLVDSANFSEMNKIWEGWLRDDTAPARATVQAKLMEPQYAVEISIIAATSGT
jgi:enamine deaminase RidA (YjgF/YER057c/UK114 family)